MRNITEERGSDFDDLQSLILYTHIILSPGLFPLKFSTKIHSSRILGLYMPAHLTLSVVMKLTILHWK